jgi:hypothetical protein
MAPLHVFNWFVGWSLLLSAFATGALIGLFFHRDDFMGGYGSFRRRIARLGHIALAALGIINVVFSLSPWPVEGTRDALVASYGFVVGGVTMPAVCFLSAWRAGFRHLFFIPVTALVVAAIATLQGGVR